MNERQKIAHADHGRSSLALALLAHAIHSTEYGLVPLPEKSRSLENEAQYEAFRGLMNGWKPISPLTTTTNDRCIAAGVVSEGNSPKIGRGERRRRAERKRREKLGVKPL